MVCAVQCCFFLIWITSQQYLRVKYNIHYTLYNVYHIFQGLILVIHGLKNDLESKTQLISEISLENMDLKKDLKVTYRNNHLNEGIVTGCDSQIVF